MYRLTGVKCHEFTEASTAGLVSAKTLEYDEYIFDKLGLPKSLMAPLRQPGESLGMLLDEVASEVGGTLEVLLCATHDTGSAVEAIDMELNAPYISSGTWSLLGVKTEMPITDEKSRVTGYSNEGGVGYNRYQKNITGLWLVQSLRRELCPELSYDEIADMAEASGYPGTFDINDDAFTAPKSMAEAISSYITARGGEAPKKPGDYFNAAYCSLALGYEAAIEDLEVNTGCHYSEIFIVGGGAKCDYLNRLSEAATGKRVVALPIEATAIGNLKVQMKRS
jgi:rhamnulokinase